MTAHGAGAALRYALAALALAPIGCTGSHPPPTEMADPEGATVENQEAGADAGTIGAGDAPDFTSVHSILHYRCRPCHFEGGQMYDRLPFDREDTVVLLGERLFTRIKDEGEQTAIRRFLAAVTAPEQ